MFSPMARPRSRNPGRDPWQQLDFDGPSNTIAVELAAAGVK